MVLSRSTSGMTLRPSLGHQLVYPISSRLLILDFKAELLLFISIAIIQFSNIKYTLVNPHPIKVNQLKSKFLLITNFNYSQPYKWYFIYLRRKIGLTILTTHIDIIWIENYRGKMKGGLMIVVEVMNWKINIYEDNIQGLFSFLCLPLLYY